MSRRTNASASRSMRATVLRLELKDQTAVARRTTLPLSGDEGECRKGGIAVERTRRQVATGRASRANRSAHSFHSQNVIATKIPVQTIAPVLLC